MTPLRIVFMGTPDFAVPPLAALHRAGHTIVAAYAQPPRPAGRGQSVKASSVQIMAESLGIPVRTPKSLKKTEEQEALAALRPDMAVVAAYGLILPQAVLDIPRLGCVNIHASLLPRWRGAAPIQRAILAGDTETGVTIMRMEAGLDTGPMLTTAVVPITSATTAGVLHDALAEAGARLIPEAVAALAEGRLPSVPQPEDGVTYAAKLTREDGLIDWTKSAAFIERQVRALTPWPGTQCTAGGEPVKLLQASVVFDARSAAPGTLLDDRFTVACGEGAVRCDLVQRPGKKPTDGASLLRGMRVPVGQVLA